MAAYSAYTDQELVALLKQGDELALSALYMRYWDKLLVVAGNRLDDLEEAEEAVQDVFFSLWQRREMLELKHSLATYLAVAVKYRIIKALDKRYRIKNKIENAGDLDLQVLSPSADAAMLEHELFNQIAVAINKLPEKCRIVFTMSREQGKSHKEIASELNISTKTVEAHLNKAMKDLKNNLGVLYPAILWVLGNRW
jgi:RNA polymerase sigma-70 factor (family 1)